MGGGKCPSLWITGICLHQAAGQQLCGKWQEGVSQWSIMYVLVCYLSKTRLVFIYYSKNKTIHAQVPIILYQCIIIGASLSKLHIDNFGCCISLICLYLYITPGGFWSHHRSQACLYAYIAMMSLYLFSFVYFNFGHGWPSKSSQVREERPWRQNVKEGPLCCWNSWAKRAKNRTVAWEGYIGLDALNELPPILSKHLKQDRWGCCKYVLASLNNWSVRQPKRERG